MTFHHEGLLEVSAQTVSALVWAGCRESPTAGRQMCVEGLEAWKHSVSIYVDAYKHVLVTHLLSIIFHSCREGVFLSGQNIKRVFFVRYLL